MIQGVVSSWWVFILLGIVAGFLSGMLGIGSGIVFIPVLVLLLAFPQKTAQGTALAVMVPMALVGAIRYAMNPQNSVSFCWLALLSVGAVAGAFIGAELAQHVPGSVLRKTFAIFIILVGIKMAWPVRKETPRTFRNGPPTTQARPLQVEREELNVGR